ncbi:MAG: dTDP-4-dehydrorhamnose 3,5-epimerase [Crocinitomicaceae bacterium]|nr:dTDP-4-dehydrorhamnose 3,5-epimerase [Crocinitomicaceae bacterium]|tara:strand:- start:10773 stop:11324 length:552 start_codon:yes stop_codon:yes gene_type:complete
MEIIEEALNGVKLLKPRVFEDHRGYFYEPYNINAFKKIGITDTFIQDNQSLSVEHGVLRGLHFQNVPYAQAKLVRVIFGKVLDVAVDIRKGSPTYGQQFSAILSQENKHLMYIPEGFAHGFATLAPNTLFSYKCSNVYDKDSEEGIAWDDADLNIDWGVSSPILSEKDKVQTKLAAFTSKFDY